MIRQIVAGALLLLLAGCGSQSSASKTWITGSLRLLTEEEKTVIANHIRNELENPESARFKWLPLQPNSQNYYCGYIYTENSSGEYTEDVM